MMRFFTAALMLAMTAAVVWFNPPENLALGRGVLQSVPATFGPWSGTDYSFEDAVIEELKAEDMLIRRYEDSGRTVWLCVVYHQNKRYGSHDPQLCYDSQGFVIESEGQAVVPDGTGEGLVVNTFTAERQKEKRVVWYWWSTDGLSTADAGAFRARMAVSGALENRSWGAFVRVETVVRDGDMAGARARVAEFSQRVAHELPGIFAGARTNPEAAR